MKIQLPVSITAESGWDLDKGECVRILFGSWEVCCIPVDDNELMDDDDISRVAGEWLAARLGEP